MTKAQHGGHEALATRSDLIGHGERAEQLGLMDLLEGGLLQR